MVEDHFNIDGRYSKLLVGISNRKAFKLELGPNRGAPYDSYYIFTDVEVTNEAKKSIKKEIDECEKKIKEYKTIKSIYIYFKNEFLRIEVQISENLQEYMDNVLSKKWFTYNGKTYNTETIEKYYEETQEDKIPSTLESLNVWKKRLAQLD